MDPAEVGRIKPHGELARVAANRCRTAGRGERESLHRDERGAIETDRARVDDGLTLIRSGDADGIRRRAVRPEGSGAGPGTGVGRAGPVRWQGAVDAQGAAGLPIDTKPRIREEAWILDCAGMSTQSWRYRSKYLDFRGRI